MCNIGIVPRIYFLGADGYDSLDKKEDDYDRYHNDNEVVFNFHDQQKNDEQTENNIYFYNRNDDVDDEQINLHETKQDDISDEFSLRAIDKISLSEIIEIAETIQNKKKISKYQIIITHYQHRYYFHLLLDLSERCVIN